MKKETKKQRNERLSKSSQEFADFIQNTKEGQDLYKAAQELSQIELDYVFSNYEKK